MSTLLGPSRTTGTPSSPPAPPSVLGSAAFSAVQAAAASLVAVGVPVVLTWIVSTGGQATWTQVVQVALSIWLLAQHAGLAVPGGHIGLMPMGLTVLPLLACGLAGRRLARVLDPRGDRIASGASSALPVMPPVRAMVVFVATYSALAAVAAIPAAMPGSRPIVPQAAVGAAVVCGLAGTLGAASYARGRLRDALAGVVSSLPSALSRLVRPAVTALLVQLAGSLLIVLTLVVLERDRVLALQRALHPDLVGGFVLALAQLTLLPNLVMWAGSVAAGPGFAFGIGTSITPTAVTLGPLPAIPVLGALPPPGRMPGVALAVLALPVLAGVLAGWRLRRDQQDGWLRPLLDATGVGLLAGIGFGVLAWLSCGPAGPGRLAVTGPVAWLAGAAFAGEVALAVAVTCVLIRVVPIVADLALGRGRRG